MGQLCQSSRRALDRFPCVSAITVLFPWTHSSGAQCDGFGTASTHRNLSRRHLQGRSRVAESAASLSLVHMSVESRKHAMCHRHPCEAPNSPMYAASFGPGSKTAPSRSSQSPIAHWTQYFPDSTSHRAETSLRGVRCPRNRRNVRIVSADVLPTEPSVHPWPCSSNTLGRQSVNVT
jgi:hypothetical protein